jgi:S-adenosylmethionine:tRNA ribosyltransferase-isomerase
MHKPDIAIENYDYDLPQKRIAKYPTEKRGDSRLLVYKDGEIQDQWFNHLPNCLPSDALLIFNDTKVIRARLPFQKKTGAHIEIFCLQPEEPSDVALAFAQTQEVSWRCLIGNQKKWKEGPLEKPITIQGSEVVLCAEKAASMADGFVVKFSWNNPKLTFSEIMEALGETPIPPYLERASEPIDRERYQTIYSQEQGSVAAPTAGLHFTNEIMNRLHDAGIQTQNLTLHVGAGTFKPVKSSHIEAHDMHTEHFHVSIEMMQTLIEHTGPNIAVGTTSVRTLESLYWAGVLAGQNKDYKHIEQWLPYNTKSDLTFKEALSKLVDTLKAKGLSHYSGSSSIIIVPGYHFRSIDALITNFHQPRSTLLLLIAALTNNDWQNIYKHALKNSYRFLSYGDSSLLWKSVLV